MKARSHYLLYSLFALCLLAATLVLLAFYGKAQRRFGLSGAVGTARLDIVSVDRPEDAFLAWNRRGYRGRVVVSFSRRLNFVETTETRLIPPTSSFPVRVDNLSRMAQRELATENFLYIAMRSGIARELIQVVPQAEMAAKIAAAVEEGVMPRHGTLSLPVMGAPRTITPPDSFANPGEAVLLYVNASYFRDAESGELVRLLAERGVVTDCVVLAASSGDGEVGDRERQRLQEFRRLLEAGHAGR
ncbi:MAG TPA: hypothetical protein VI389_07535 [Geobacteraceae bacterium]